ncbi:MAG TPA: helix-turn-helix domain-containing protein [Candidatus Saccharimonadia bacterium]|jgi:DNA-binding HxlR family transcriptional regulator|nr:helix-turn-helix domain-containing protein [Candidatus Saccharimonadia bacterium]
MYDVSASEHGEDCGIAKALTVIGGKWTLLIIRDLLDNPCRFSELEGSLEGISPRTLAIRLKELEHDGVLKRDCSGGEAHPIYRLTDKGRSLSVILDQMRAWGNAAVTVSATED